jgi:hypothetical protein
VITSPKPSSNLALVTSVVAMCGVGYSCPGSCAQPRNKRHPPLCTAKLARGIFTLRLPTVHVLRSPLRTLQRISFHAGLQREGYTHTRHGVTVFPEA